MPPRFDFGPGEKGLWTSDSAAAGNIVARLKSRVTLDEANAQLKVVTARLTSKYPKVMEGCELSAWPFGRETGGLDDPLLLLFGAVGFVLLIACVNVSSLHPRSARGKSAALDLVVRAVFGNQKFTDMKTVVGIVTTSWDFEKPMIFKTNVARAHGRENTFVPGFGCSTAAAVRASCSAYPFFRKAALITSKGDTVTLMFASEPGKMAGERLMNVFRDGDLFDEPANLTAELTDMIPVFRFQKR